MLRQKRWSSKRSGQKGGLAKRCGKKGGLAKRSGEKVIETSAKAREVV